MPCAPISAALDKHSGSPCDFGPLWWWDDLPDGARAGAWADAWRAYVRTLDADATLYSYVCAWLRDAPDVPPLGSRPGSRLAADGRDWTLITPGRDLDVCIGLLRGLRDASAAALADALWQVCHEYRAAHLAFIEEAVAHPRRHKFNDFFQRVRYTRAEQHRLDAALARARDACAGAALAMDDEEWQHWRAWARDEAAVIAARILVTRALEAGALDGARDVLVAYWSGRAPEERVRAARAQSNAELERWAQWLVGESAARGRRAVIDERSVLASAPRVDRDGAHVRRRVGFDRMPLEGEIIIAADTADALGRLHAYRRGGNLTAPGGGDQWLIGIHADVLPDLVAHLRSHGAPVGPIVTARRGWWSKRFGRLMVGAATAVRCGDAVHRVGFLAPVRGCQTAAVTQAGLRRAVRESGAAEALAEVFPGARPGYVAIPWINNLPAPVADHGLPDLTAGAVDVATLAGAERCAHAGAHWIACERSRVASYIALACPRCLDQRLAVVEAHRIPDAAGASHLRDEIADDADMRTQYVAELARQRALAGQPLPARDWDALCRAEPVVDLEALAGAISPWEPAAIPDAAPHYSLEDAFFG